MWVRVPPSQLNTVLTVRNCYKGEVKLSQGDLDSAVFLNVPVAQLDTATDF